MDTDLRLIYGGYPEHNLAGDPVLLSRIYRSSYTWNFTLLPHDEIFITWDYVLRLSVVYWRAESEWFTWDMPK